MAPASSSPSLSSKTGGRLGIALLVVASLVLLSRLVPGASGNGDPVAGPTGPAGAAGDASTSGSRARRASSIPTGPSLEREVRLAAGAALSLEVDAADVEIAEGARGGTARVTAVLKRGATAEDLGWEVDESGDRTRVELKSKKERRAWAGLFGGGREAVLARVIVRVPAGHAVELTSGAGDVGVGPLAGDLTLRTGAGDVTLEGVGGRLDAHTGAGDMTALTRGAASVKTGAGDVELTAQSGSVHARTGAGDIIVRALGRLSSIDAHTGIGAIVVETGAMRDLELDAASGLGSVEVDLPGTEPMRTTGPSGHLETRLGAGTVPVELRTGAGSIHVRPGLQAL